MICKVEVNYSLQVVVSGTYRQMQRCLVSSLSLFSSAPDPLLLTLLTDSGPRLTARCLTVIHKDSSYPEAQLPLTSHEPCLCHPIEATDVPSFSYGQKGDLVFDSHLSSWSLTSPAPPTVTSCNKFLIPSFVEILLP